MRESLRLRRLVAVMVFMSAGCAGGSRPVARAGGPELVGPETISVGNVFRGTFTPDGDTLYYFRNVTEGQEDYRIFRAHRIGGSWSEPERLTLEGDHSDLYPAITPDGQRMVFSSYRPAPGDTSSHPSAYLWYVRREGGSWGRPVFMAEASAWSHYHSQPIFDAHGDLHFSRSRWDHRGHSEHVSRWEGTRYGSADTSAAWRALRDRVPARHHLYETTPGYDGSFTLLVMGARPDSGRPGPPDLYVSWRADTGWTSPQPLRSGVNTTLTENFAFYGPGGRELYFVRDFAALYRVSLGRALGLRAASRIPPHQGTPERPLRVLFVGNSFTFGHDIPRLVAERGAGLDPPMRIDVSMVARDGMTLERHWEEGRVARLLSTGRWDVVILQEQSSRPLAQPELTEVYARRLAALARESGADVVLFETWSRVDEPETAEPRAAAYRRIAEALGASVAPVGTAWRRSRTERPDLTLHADDGLHANPAGARLAASVILETLLRTRPGFR